MGNETTRPIITLDNGNSYEGEIIDGQFEGKGVFCYKNGDSIKGNFVKGQAKGEGTISFVKRVSSLPVQDKDSPPATPLETSLSWETEEYEGEFEVDAFNTLIFTSKDPQHEINFKRTAKSGKGRAVTFHANIYEGNWLKGMKEGHGVKHYLGGGRYEGNWLQNKRSGNGEMEDDTGKYKGEMLNDKEHGYGTKHYANNDIYQGYWKEGLRSGYGKMMYKDGVVYEGNWSNNIKEGQGKLIDQSGNEKRGYWEQDVLISRWREGCYCIICLVMLYIAILLAYKLYLYGTHK